MRGAVKPANQILLALALGAAAGALLGEKVLVISFVGTLFLKLIKMVVIPLIVSSMIVGVAGLDIRDLGRVGRKTFALYLGTLAVAVVVGGTLADVIEPGAGVDLGAAARPPALAEEPPSLGEAFLGMVPENPLQALVKPDILQAILFSLLLGVALNFIGERGRPVLAFMESLFAAMMKITDWVLRLAPYGVFALIATTIARSGLGVLIPLAKYCVTVALGLAFQFLVVYPALMYAYLRVNPMRVYKASSEALAMAFSTASSSATLPVTMEALERKVGVENRIASFVVPLGATLNMDGTALYEAVAALFIAQAYGIDLTVGQQATVMIMSALAAMGAAGIPSAGLVTMALVLSAVGLPLEGIGLILSVDRLLDMGRTMVNVAGDVAVAAAVGKSEGAIDLAVLEENA